ncbi:DNA-binding protein HEXBP-like [Cucumis melo var. makuwa]|uniref:DNA-binding protein HEXBP-like n=1 Tax=Cucumis melo var. makuwa TaxID=1194695 RepID=A0A5A7TP98_CUCMM|nr:DNA-binding protein HEXBP-like [Cucumis melo var. makuwa]TYK29754.1 DNA-binding protein HEXBP-like [Cucumis melo var. makuwa]
MILVIADLCFVLMEECPHFPTQNASQTVRDAYNCWTKATDKVCIYILASMSDILSKKYEIMITARQITNSLREIDAEMNKIEYNITSLLNKMQSFQSLKGQKKGEVVAQSRRRRKGKSSTAIAKGKRKAKVAIKGKCFHYNVDAHWKRNCSKYLAKKKDKEGN